MPLSDAITEWKDSAPVKDSFRVALVCMPFAAADRPSIQVGLIHALAEQAGFETDAYYFNLDLAARLSPNVYDALSMHRGHMTGEWLFAPAAFGSSAPGDESSYFQAFPEELEWARQIGKDGAYYIELRRHVLPSFVEECLAAVDWHNYRLVGFSTTFQQNVACLALASRIKERHPEIAIVFGGANMEGEMGPEYARAFPFIDYAVSGEGDQVFPALLRSLAAREPAAPVPGLIVRTKDGLASGGQAPPVTKLDASPVPNYGPHFDRANQIGVSAHYKSRWMLPFESSRGCWWGQKHHCTFCGLNGLGMSYRAKSTRRVLSELSELTRMHRINAFAAVDNILDLKYLEALFIPIEQAKLDYRFFYETKANLTHAQIQTLYRGGVRHLQPGIESMSTHVLQLMRKGCTMLQNVRCLKWCLYYNVRVSWNLIWGFPGETDADYQQELEILRSIGHLEPPKNCGRIWLERFSPYYTEREAFPVRNMRAEESYRYVYPQEVDLDKAAYYFDYDMGDTASADAHEATSALIRQWQQCWHSKQRYALTYRRISDGLLVDYRWGPERQGTYSLFGPLALMYDFCVETMHTANQVREHLQSAPEGREFSLEEVRDALDEFCRARLMLSEEGRYFSLAIPSNPNW
jgi:ribosomal peptide maturation radical SAM protein 1